MFYLHTMNMDAASSSYMSALHVHTVISQKHAIFIHQHHCENHKTHYCTFFAIFMPSLLATLGTDNFHILYSIRGECLMCLNN